MVNEKRIAERYRTSWKIYDGRESQKILVGYIMNISETGAKVYLQKAKKITDKQFKITFISPAEWNISPISLLCNKVWEKDQAFFELGFQFITNNDDDKEKVKNFIRLFQNDKKNLGEVILKDKDEE